MGIPFDALYGAGATQPAPVITYLRAWVEVTAKGTTTRGTLLVNATGAPVVLVQARMAAAVRDGLAVRDIVRAEIGWGGPYISQPLAHLAISPEQVSDSTSLGPQGMLVPAGEDIIYGVWNSPFAGGSSVYLGVIYYLAEVT